MSQKCDGTEQDPRLQTPEVEKARAGTDPKYICGTGTCKVYNVRINTETRILSMEPILRCK